MWFVKPATVSIATSFNVSAMKNAPVFGVGIIPARAVQASGWWARASARGSHTGVDHPEAAHGHTHEFGGWLGSMHVGLFLYPLGALRAPRAEVPHRGSHRSGIGTIEWLPRLLRACPSAALD